MAESPQLKEQPKHRACDECRSRKLACSKEPDGCARCRREGIKCVFSPQKPMGRPRKRPCPDDDVKQKPKQQQPKGPPWTAAPAPTETTASASGPSSSSLTPSTPAASSMAASTADTYNPFAPTTVPPLDDFQMDFNWSLLDSTAGDMSFLDFMNLDPHQPFDPALVAPELLSLTYPVEPPKPMSKWEFGIGGLFDGATFNNLSLDMEPAPQSAVSESSSPALVGAPTETSPSSAKTPSLTSESSSPDSCATDQPHSGHSHRPSTPCVCLANLYLALEGLQKLPTGVRDAMCAARYASRVAHDCVECPSCSAPLLTQVQAPIQSTQNMLILGALLTVAADAYMKVIPMIDQEVARARAERRKLFFSIEDFGGVWGRMAQQKECSHAEALQGDMDPTLWRQIMRAMLKLDVYGMDQCKNDGKQLKHLGLRDVIEKMEERSIRRHQHLDDSEELNTALKAMKCPPLTPGERPTCLRIIDMAKAAVQDIVIP